MGITATCPQRNSFPNGHEKKRRDDGGGKGLAEKSETPPTVRAWQQQKPAFGAGFCGEVLLKKGSRGFRMCLVCLATTYSPALAVPSALERFTAEFEMGSGGGAPPESPGKQSTFHDLIRSSCRYVSGH